MSVPQYPEKEVAATEAVVGVVATATPMTGEHNPLIGTVVLPAVQTWSSGLLDVLDDINSTVDATFCRFCQASRQYNVITYGSRDVEPWTMLGSLLMDIAFGQTLHLGTCLLNMHVRRRLRERYMIDGTGARDLMESFFCPCCSLAQQYREMSLRGEWPSGSCIQRPYERCVPLAAPPVIVMAAENTPSKEVAAAHAE